MAAADVPRIAAADVLTNSMVQEESDGNLQTGSGKQEFWVDHGVDLTVMIGAP